MRGRPSGRFDPGWVVCLALLVGCAAPTPATPSNPPASGQVPTGSANVSPTPGRSTPGGGLLGTEPIGEPGAQPGPVDQTPTSSDLILADVANGTLDADTGLMYRLYASFGDDRLPAAYATSSRTVDEDAIRLAAYRTHVGDLPSAIADSIRPFVLRPTNPQSAFHAPAVAVSRSASVMPAVLVAQGQPACGANGWATLRSSSQPVKVWAHCDDPRLAGLLADALTAAETLYSEMSDAQMMGPAILDSGELLTDEGIDAGGDNAIDIYFSSTCVQRQSQCKSPAELDAAAFASPALPYPGPAPAWTSSGYIVIDRVYGDSRTDIWSLIAHEMFHVLQFAHNGGTYADASYIWFVEASAKWSQQYFVPDARTRWTYPRFSQFQTAKVGLTSTQGHNQYASFAWPYFMEHVAGYTSIGDAWRALEGKSGMEAMNAALAATFSFEEHFKDFAVRALNTRLQPGDPSSPNMQVPDASFPQVAPSAALGADEAKQRTLGVFEPRDKGNPLTVPVAVPPLGVRYHVFGVADTIAKLEFDFSDVTPTQALDVEALVFIHDKGWERRSLSDGKTTFCRDRPDDDIDGGILVIADHSWADAERLTGSYTVAPLAEPCADGTYKIDLAAPGVPNAAQFGAGHYEGEGKVDCFKVFGKWSIGGFYVSDDPRPSVLSFDANESGVQVSLRDFPSEGGTVWFVNFPNPAYEASISVRVDDSVRPATFDVLATNIQRDMRLEGTCSHVSNEDDTPPPLP